MKSKHFVIILIIVLLDLVTKLAANYFLQFHEKVEVIEGCLSLFLTYNQDAIGTRAIHLVAGDNVNISIILSCASGLILFSFLVFVVRLSLKLVYKAFLVIAMYFIVSLSVVMLQPILVEVIVSTWVASVIAKLTGLIIYGVIFYLVKDALVKFFVAFLLACGVGNLLSCFYFPYEVIDFIYVDCASGFFELGVFNFADFVFDVGVIGVLISVMIFMIRKRMNVKAKTSEINGDDGITS